MSERRGTVFHNQTIREAQTEESAALERATMFAEQGRYELPAYEDLRTGDGEPLPPQDERSKRIDDLTRKYLSEMRPQEHLMRRLVNYAARADRDPATAPRLCAEAHALIVELYLALRGVVAVADRKTVEFDIARNAIAKVAPPPSELDRQTHPQTKTEQSNDR